MHICTRTIGIRHRVKASAKGEALPTIVTICEDGDITKSITLELDDEQDELDFAFGILPARYRKVTEEDDLSKIKLHHLKGKKLKKGEEEGLPEKLVFTIGKEKILVTEIPAVYEGLKAHDTVVMPLGGSGDNFAFALSSYGEIVGAKVFRCPPHALKADRDARERDKKDDSVNVVELFGSNFGKFYEVKARDRALILVRESLRARDEAMKARMGCAQRLRQLVIGAAFTSPGGGYEQGGIEKQFDARQANDPVLRALEGEEARRNRELAKALEFLPVYTVLLSLIEGVGPSIAARIIASIGDIRNFETAAKLKAFCGVHVNGTDGNKLKPGQTPPTSGGVFARKRRGVQCNWNPTLRQAMFLLMDQFNRRPKSEWGEKLIANKAHFRTKHPEKMQVEVPDLDKPGQMKKVWKYNDGHILRMAQWRTVTKFIEWLFREWTRLEKETASAPKVGSGPGDEIWSPKGDKERDAAAA